MSDAEAISEVLTSILARDDAELYAKQEHELKNDFFWEWEEGSSLELNTYEFFSMLEIHKRRCRRWEEKHNGSCCVVERVRDKYVLPQVRRFVSELVVRTAGTSVGCTAGDGG